MRQLQTTWWIKVNKYSCYAHNSTSGQVAKTNERGKLELVTVHLEEHCNLTMHSEISASTEITFGPYRNLCSGELCWPLDTLCDRVRSSVTGPPVLLELCSHSFSFIYVALKVRWASVYHNFFNPVTRVSVATAFFRSMTFIAIEWSKHLS